MYLIGEIVNALNTTIQFKAGWTNIVTEEWQKIGREIILVLEEEDRKRNGLTRRN